MISFSHANTKVELFDSVQELPMLRSATLHRYLALQAEVPTEGGSVADGIARAMQLGELKEWGQQSILLQNLLFGLHLCSEGIQPESMAFAALVYRVNGQVYDDMSDSGLQKVLEKTKNIPAAIIRQYLEAIKKNFRESGSFSSQSITEAFQEG
jgi:hypothetical protein